MTVHYHVKKYNQNSLRHSGKCNINELKSLFKILLFVEIYHKMSHYLIDRLFSTATAWIFFLMPILQSESYKTPTDLPTYLRWDHCSLVPDALPSDFNHLVFLHPPYPHPSGSRTRVWIRYFWPGFWHQSYTKYEITIYKTNISTCHLSQSLILIGHRYITFININIKLNFANLYVVNCAHFALHICSSSSWILPKRK